MNPLAMPSPTSFRSRLLRSGAAAAFAAAVLAVASPARALPEFPGKIDEALKLTCAPPCTICHLMPTPQVGASAEQPFADNVRAAAEELSGMPASTTYIEENLAAILKRLEQAPCPNTNDKSCPNGMCSGACNADGTGEGDIAELIAAQNPNNAGTLPCVEYGCGSHVAPERHGRPLDGTAALFALGAALVLARRFRR